MATREELRELAALRLREAETLFGAGFYDGCLYLCGYVVELALKAQICSLLGITEYPDDRMPAAFRTHNFDQLRLLAGLQNEITPDNGALFANWSIATEWKPELRYQPAVTTREKAEVTLEAVRGDPNGVFTWLRQRW